MDSLARRRRAALAFYGPLAAAPSPARRVGWEDDDAHRLRLSALVEALGPLAALPTLLDAGAGESALLPVLRRRGFTGAYRAEDVLPHMVDAARAAHAADPAAAFACADAFDPAGPRAAAVVCSGALNTRADSDDHDAEVALALDALWARAERVLVVDLAVADRHPPGAGLAPVDLARAWAHARSLAPVVAVREDVAPGEALLVLARSRRPALEARLPDPTDALARARLLLASGEPAEALALAAGREALDARMVAALAELALGQLGPAEAALRRLADTPHGPTARLHLAAVLWRTGRRRAAEALLRELAPASDDARAHLAELLAARGDHAEALTVAAAIADPWMRREVERRAARPDPPG